MNHLRKRACITAEFKAGSQRGVGQIRNVGEGGLFVGTASIPEEGEEVALRFRAPGGETVVLKGMVWWTTQHRAHRTPGFGLRLLDESEGFQRLYEGL